jgi:O-antigen/teichoic acid export membrane protein
VNLRSVMTAARGRLNRGEFARNLLILTSGSVVGQVIGVLATPVLTRLYTPDEYGVMGVYVSVLGIITVAAMLRYEAAIPISETGSDALTVLALSCGIAVVSSLACAALVLLAVRPITGLLRMPPLAGVAWLLPIGILGYSIYGAFSMWAVRGQEFQVLARTKVTQGIGLVATQLGLGLLGVGSAGLIIGQIVGHSTGITTLGRQVRKRHPEWSGIVSWEGMCAAARRYRRFPKFSLGAALVNSASYSLPLLFVGSVLGTTIAGWYTLVVSTLFYPINLLYVNVSQVYRGEIARLRYVNPGAMPAIFWRRTWQGGCIGLAILVPLNAVAPWLVPLLFGSQWSGAVTCLWIMSPAGFAALLEDSTDTTLETLERQDLYLTREIFMMAVTVLALAFAYLLRANWRLSLGVISAFRVVSYLFCLWLSWFAIRSYVRTLPGG